VTLLVVPALLAQTAHLSPRDLLRVDRALSGHEIATILSASRDALTAKTFRLASVQFNTGPDILMGRAGRPRIVRWTGAIEGGVAGPARPDGTVPTTHSRREYIKIVEYRDRSVADCRGSRGGGELVVEYERDLSSTRWSTTTRELDGRDFGGIGIAAIFEMLQGHGPLTSGERRRINGRSARALVSAWKPPARNDTEPPFLRGDPIPNVRGERAAGEDEAVQSLWIDSASLLPLRWEASNQGLRAFGFDFAYSAIALRRPAGVKLPPCRP
jgi:hypothetical protein